MILFLVYFLFFLFFQTITVYGGDAGDLVAAAYVRGFAHPPGYPLYSFFGYLVTRIPFSTVAWRVSLLSSIPAALTLMNLYLSLHILTRSRAVALIASLFLAANYLFWLYAIVPEVFLMHMFLSSSLILLGLIYYREPKVWHIYIGSLILGLGFSHHHMIVLAIPPLLYLFALKRRSAHMNVKQYALAVLSFGAGLLPYLWIIFVAFKIPLIAWSDPRTVSKFFKLITRADYGTFQSAVAIGNQIQSRFLQFGFIFENYLQDFTVLGILLCVIGMLGLLRKDRRLFVYLFSSWLIAGPLYFFYASYLYTSGFLIATAERFLLPSYYIATIFIGLGIYYTQQFLKKSRTLYYIPQATAIILALILLSVNYPKLSILKNDTTAEKFGIDIVRPVEKNSILLLSGDIAIFNTQHAVYVLGVRPDVTPIHLAKFLAGKMDAQVRKYYPWVEVPPFSQELSFFHAFIDMNYSTHPIYTTMQVSNIPTEYTLIPQGMLLRLYKKTDVPPYTEVIATSNKFWASYQEPLSGSLQKYHNLMLANVLDYYTAGRTRNAVMASIYGQDLLESIRQVKNGQKLQPKDQNLAGLLVLNYIDLKKCADAKQALDAYKQLLPQPETHKRYVEFMLQLTIQCGDKQDVSAWRKKLEEIERKSEIPLQNL